MTLSDTSFGGQTPGVAADDPSSSGMNEDRALDMLEWDRSDRVKSLFDFEPWDYQAEVLDADSNRGIWICGRQVGKTETAGVIPADWVLTHPGEDALIAAVFQETADELFERTKDHFDRLGDPGTIGIEQPNTKTYTLDTGGRVLSRTLGGSDDGANQRGKLPSCIVAEEATLINGDVYDKVLRPMFATHDEYLLLLIGTPRGKSGYVWDKWRSADENDMWDTWRAETSDSPLVSSTWLEEVRSDVDSLTFDQEYRGRFVETGDEYLPESLVRPSVTDTPISSTEAREGPVYLALDPARGGSDRSVYIFLDSAGRVFNIESFETESTPKSVRRLKGYDRIYGFRLIGVEENGHGGGVFDYANEDLPNVVAITTSLERKGEVYKNIKTAFEGGRVSLPDDGGGDDEKRLFNQTTRLTYSFSKNGKVQVSHPPGGHDDYPDALAFAFWIKRLAERRDSRDVVESRSRPSKPKGRSRRSKTSR